MEIMYETGRLTGAKEQINYLCDVVPLQLHARYRAAAECCDCSRRDRSRSRGGTRRESAQAALIAYHYANAKMYLSAVLAAPVLSAFDEAGIPVSANDAIIESHTVQVAHCVLRILSCVVPERE